jgi:hypothetical protein
MTETTCHHCTQFTDAVETAHERALDALTSEPAQPMKAVIWLSAHLAAAERSIHPAVKRWLPDATDLLAEEHRVMHAIADKLRLLERYHAGDAGVSRLNAGRVRSELVALLVDHAANEHSLLDQLARVIGPSETDQMIAAYNRTLERAPTRPHPHVPRHGVLGRLGFRATAIGDAILDTLDGRPHPTPKRTRRPHKSRRYTT